MRIGVVSDTHDHHSNVRRIVELFHAAQVERVVHTGDFTTVATLEIFARLDAPLAGVVGNNDADRAGLFRAAAGLGYEIPGERLELSWCDRSIVVVHDPADATASDLARHDVLLHGHTHREVRKERRGCLVFNPGECAGHLEGHNRVGVLDLTTLETELLRF